MYLTEEEEDKLAGFIQKIHDLVIKHDKLLKQIPSLSTIKEIKQIDFEVDEQPVSQINRLLREGWKLLALNQYTRLETENQIWGSIAYLGRTE